MEKTICAISTPIGAGGISVIRLSGTDSLNIVNKILLKPLTSPEPRKMVLKTIKTQNFCDKAMVVFFKAPFSYTGEDIVEIQCHGGIFLTNEILKELISCGATLAENGEFTKRAFLNGKISLDQSEGVIDLINAESESALKAGYNLLNGQLYKEITQKQDILTDILAEIEVSLDYPEHDIEYTTLDSFKTKISSLICDVMKILDTSSTGMIIKNGINVALVGVPNVGKSSLMNSLLGYKRAIVTNLAGTTRDTLEESYVFGGVKVNLIDTAGIRESDNEIEKIGVNLAKEKISSSDLVLFVLDSSRKISEEEKQLFSQISNTKYIIVVNKIDCLSSEFKLENLSEKFKNFDEKCTNSLKKNLNNSYKNIVFTSTTQNKNIEKLKENIYNLVLGGKIISGTTMITNLRHKTSLEKGLNALNDALKTLSSTENLELVSIDLNSTYQHFGEITGTTSSEDIIDRIFSKFCLGK